MRPFPAPNDSNYIAQISSSSKEKIDGFRAQIANIIQGVDSRLLVILGPCSIDCPESAIQYAQKIIPLKESLKDRFFIVMRAFIEKSRTREGWKGFIHDPDLDNSYDILKGVQRTRQLFEQLTQMDIPLAAEFLDPLLSAYYQDYISWGCIGARTCSSSTHRALASSLPLPIGFKNSLDGDHSTAINAAYSAKDAHHILKMGPDGTPSLIKSQGNPNCHAVLRGGYLGTNYDPQSIQAALNTLQSLGLTESIVIDCSHGNAQKNYLKQIDVFKSVVHQLREGNNKIKGIMLESYLEEGSQAHPTDPTQKKKGISITDPCINFITTEALLTWANTILETEQSSLSFHENM